MIGSVSLFRIQKTAFQEASDQMSAFEWMYYVVLGFRYKDFVSWVHGKIKLAASPNTICSAQHQTSSALGRNIQPSTDLLHTQIVKAPEAYIAVDTELEDFDRRLLLSMSHCYLQAL